MNKTLLALAGLALACGPAVAAPDTVDTTWAGSNYFDTEEFGGPASLLVQPNGKLLVGSNWMSAQNGALFLPLTRFNIDGTVDETFHADATPNGEGSGIFYDQPGQPEVHGLALQSDGKILAVGCMQGMRDGITTAASTNALISNGIVRITPGGDPDTTFQSAGIDTEFIDEVITLPNDQIIVAGGFNAVKDQGGPFVTRYGIAQLNADGSLDTSFQVNPASLANIVPNSLFIRQVAPTPSGKLYIVGSGQPVGGTIFDDTPIFARLNSDGSLDTSFAPSYPSSVTSFSGVVVEPDGKITALGSQGNTSSSTNFMARFTETGANDGSFAMDASLTRYAARPLRRDPVGRYLLFKRDLVEGNSQLVRINNDGSLDPTFNASGSWNMPPFGNGPTNAFFNQAITSPTGKIYAGGGFDFINGEPSVKVVAFEGDEVPNAPGTLQLGSFAFSASECDGSMLIPIVRINGATGAASVDYSFSTALGNATAGADFDATGGTVSFAAGEAGTKYISIPLVDDSLVENFETFTIDLANATGAALGTPTQGFATIIDSDSPPIVVSQPLPLFVAPLEFFQISVGAISGKNPTTYQWFKDGVALSGATSPLYFQTDASAAQDNGEYCVVVTNPNGSVISDKVDVVVKDPAELSFAVSSVEAVENEGLVTLTLTRGGSSVNAVSVGITLTNNSASATDYSISPTTISWADGDSADKTVTVTLNDDADIEPQETFIATLANYSPDARPGAISSLVFTILDDDSPLSITTQPLSQSLQEDESLTLTVVATSQSPLSYQWLLDDLPLAGATGETLTVDPVELTGAGSYTVEVTNAAGTVTSDPAVVEVKPAPYLPAALQPVSDLDLAVYSIALIDNQSAWVSGNSSALGQVIQKVSLDPSVAPVTITLNGQADQVITLPNGGVAARGFFTTVNGQNQSYVLKANADGSLASGQLVSGITTRPSFIAVDEQGRLLVGEGGGDLRRFDNAGILDPTFPQVSFGNNPFIQSIALEGTSIYVGGRFTSSGANTAGNYLTKLNEDGSRDETFTYGSNRLVLDIIPLDGGRVAALTQPSFGTVSQRVSLVAADGTIESQLNSLGSIAWFDFSIDDNEFVYAPRANTPWLTRQNDDGAFNTNFGGFDSIVTSVEVDAGGRAWVGGQFSTLGGDPVSKLVILNGEPGELAILDDPLLAAGAPGASATFTVNAVSSGTLSYQWRKNGVDLNGENGSSLTVDPISATDAAFYDVVVTNTDTFFSLTSETAELVVLGAPEIRQSPSSTTLIVGENLTLEVSFFAQEPLTLQWQKDGVDLAGETAATLDLTAGALSDSGNYALVVSNGLGSATSLPANIQFIPDPAALVDGFIAMPSFFGKPDYLTPGSNGGALIGGNFSAGGHPSGSLNPYLAKVDETGAPVATFLPTTSNSDSRSSDAAFDSSGLAIVVGDPRNFGFLVNGNYRNIIKLNADGTSNEPFTTNVSSQSNFDFVEVNASDQVYLAGLNKLVRLHADGTVDATFSDNFTGTPLDLELDSSGRAIILTANSILRFESDGSIDTSFSLDSSIPNSPVFRAFSLGTDDNIHLATSSSGQRFIHRITPNGTLLDTLTSPGFAGSYEVLDLALQPNGKYLIGDSQGLTRVLADGSPDPLWDIGSGFNSSVETIEITENGNIWVTGAFSQFQGNPHYGFALLNGDPVDVIITSQPMSFTADIGTSATLTIAANGLNGDPVTFQWQKDGIDIAGETDSTLSFPSLSENDEASYQVIITNTTTGRERPSTAAVVTVLSTPELIAFTGDSQNLEIDDELTLSVEAIGAGVLSYQWQKDGVDIAGANSPSFTLAMSEEADSGTYRVVVTNSLGTVTSDAVAVSVVFSPAAISPLNSDLVFNSNVHALLPLPDGRTLVGGSFTSVTYNGSFTSIDELALINADGSLDASFDLNPNGLVLSLSLDQEGGVLIGGRFSSIAGTTRSRVARLNPDLTLDSTLAPNASINGDVYSVEATIDGKYIVGGLFSQWDGNPGYLVRLNSDGSRDDSFVTPALNSVRKVIALPDGKVLAGGGFTLTGANRVGRFNEDGSLDTSYGASSNRFIFDIALQPDGKVVAVGDFGRILRFNADGSTDNTFSANAANDVETVAIDAAGKILVGGNFAQVNDEDATGLARLNSDGSLDTSFDVREGSVGAIFEIALKPLGGIWIGGGHSSYRGETAGRLTLLNGDPLDLAIVQQPRSTFSEPGSTATFSVNAVATEALTYQWQRNGVILVDGGDLSGTMTNTLSIANAEDNDEDNYQVIVTHSVTNESITSDSADLIVLGAPEILSQPEPVTTEVALDATFNVETRGASPLSFQWFRDGSPLVDSTGIAGAATNELILSNLTLTDSGSLFVRISNGLGSVDSNSVDLLVERPPASIDRSLTLPSFNSTVRAIWPEDDGSFIAGGNFTSLTYPTGSSSRRYLAKINPDGSPVLTFPEVNLGNPVYSIDKDAQGRYLIAGGFTRLRANGVFSPVNRVARINADGTVDTTFDPGIGPNNTVYQIRSLPDGKVLIAGTFSSVDNEAGTGRVARLNADGSVDTTFVSQATNIVDDIAIVGSDYWLAGGGYPASSRNARIDDTGALSSGFFYDGSMNSSEIIPTQDGGVLIAGTSYPFIEKLAADGTRSANWPNLVNGGGPNTRVYDLARLDNSRTIISGIFSSYNGTPINDIVVVDEDGVPIPGFEPGDGFGFSYPEDVKVDSEGRIWCGGAFSTYNGEDAGRIVVLNGFGTTPSDPFATYVADLPVDEQGEGDDPDSDGQGNLLEFAYGTLANDSSSRTRFAESSNIVDGTAINNLIPGSNLPPGNIYYTVTFRFPDDPRGVTITPEATLNLSDFEDGSAQILPLGAPIDDGDYYLQRYYLTPDRSSATRAFTRLKATRN